MKSHAKLRNLRVAPRKVRLLVDLIRGKRVEDALVQLQFSKKHAAVPVKKLLESAVANAVHNHQALPESLVVSTAFVDEGRTLKRWMPRAMGRATPIRKRTSHITLVLEGKATEVETVVAEKEVVKASSAKAPAAKEEKAPTKKKPAAKDKKPAAKKVKTSDK